MSGRICRLARARRKDSAKLADDDGEIRVPATRESDEARNCEVDGIAEEGSPISKESGACEISGNTTAIVDLELVF